jgi:hypothetical protein
MAMETIDHQVKTRIPGTGSSWAAKKEHATAAIIGADAPSGQPVAIQRPQQIRIEIMALAADHNAMP